jgi:hypothetical protein
MPRHARHELSAGIKETLKLRGFPGENPAAQQGVQQNSCQALVLWPLALSVNRGRVLFHEVS